jgi:hypothetical protein
VSPRPAPFDALPDALATTLVRSFQDRRDGAAGSEKNLDAYWGKSPGMDSVWELLRVSLDWQDLNTMVRVHQRMEAVDRTGALWRDHVLYLLRAYTGGIYALEMVYRSRSELRAYLDGDVIKRTEAPLLARAARWTQVMHPDTDGWREVSATDSLHISVANAEGYARAEDVHIDETSITRGRDAEGRSRQAWGSCLVHFAQSHRRWIDIDRPFWRLDQLLRKAEAEPLRRPETAAALAAWAESRGSDAVSGERGHRRAQELWCRINPARRGAPACGPGAPPTASSRRS